jgi:hypothetical protein
MADAIPRSEFHILKECGHNPVEEMPQIVRPMIEAFLLRKDDARRPEKPSGVSVSSHGSFEDQDAQPTYNLSGLRERNQ